MKLNHVRPLTLDQLSRHLQAGGPSFFTSSKTSTVIPYDQLELYLGSRNGMLDLVDLSLLPKNVDLTDATLDVTGPITWQEARAFAQSKGREILTSPTEELAAMLAGIATSATGERCFGFGSLRDQVAQLEYLDGNGARHLLRHDRLLKDRPEFADSHAKNILERYQHSYTSYKNFKNAPFPRFERETDLMTGTEGQLGVITQASFLTRPATESTFLFLLLPKWETDFTRHLAVFNFVQSKRNMIYACELLDDQSLNVLPAHERPGRAGQDLIFLEIDSYHLDQFMGDFADLTDLIGEDNIFEISRQKCRELRMLVPRATFEANSRMGVIKMGTDVQMPPEHFSLLLEFYRECSQIGLSYNLFGHFGDAHLHFNFLPTKEQIPLAEKMLDRLYAMVASWSGSPFAEHGVGLIKQKYMRHFYQKVHFEMFDYLKKCFDPKNQFFPLGFMSLKLEARP
ncbi:MAG: hypothetical protein A2X86_09060 [Bdellovibrionales bacterium GWA2_49_15]|nr:MAG: hypothetical protein A2X86_09060 [Bdellovibrionales bacterium GWA2_49_15]HAZ12926.1 hypothetical protein [Bdellovibrionales bacterium]